MSKPNHTPAANTLKQSDLIVAAKPNRADWLLLFSSTALFIIIITGLGAANLDSGFGFAKGAGLAQTLELQQSNQQPQRYSLLTDQRLQVSGPVGDTVIEIAAGKVRVASSPGAQQLCVKQGWLEQAGDTAICLPNQVMLTLLSIDGTTNTRFDGINF